MILTLDFGASTIDCVLSKEKDIIHIQTFESRSFFDRRLSVFLQKFHIDLSGVSQIRVTGGNTSLKFQHIRGIPVKRVDEIQAIGHGGYYLFQSGQYKRHTVVSTAKKRSLLVVSMGTGTCMVKVLPSGQRLSCEHVGGTGVGGGTFLGLSKALLGETDIPSLIRRFARGDTRKVDLSVREIVGSGIGIVSGTVTASNLGKLALLGLKKGEEIHFNKNDLAAGIANLIGQTIATASVFAAKAYGIETIVLGGKLTRIDRISDIIFSVAKLYGKSVILPEKGDYISALGASLL